MIQKTKKMKRVEFY